MAEALAEIGTRVLAVGHEAALVAAHHRVITPLLDEVLAPIVNVVPLQWLADHLAEIRFDWLHASLDQSLVEVDLLTGHALGLGDSLDSGGTCEFNHLAAGVQKLRRKRCRDAAGFIEQQLNVLPGDGVDRVLRAEGLGLAICRKIVEKHNGQIWVESEEGKGADFRFTLGQ